MLNKPSKLSQTKKARKIIALLLIFTLTFANWMVLGQTLTTMAVNLVEDLEAQSTKTNQNNVEFDAYFEQNQQRVHQIAPSLNAELVLNLAVEVKENGYLKDARVVLSGIGKSYELKQTEEATIQENSVILKQVNAGELMQVSLGIGLNIADKLQLSALNNTTSATLTGTYVNGDGKEIAIEKEIKIQINWQDEAEVQIAQEYTKYTDYKTEEAQGTILQSLITVKRNEDLKNLPIEETRLIIKGYEIEGKKLVKVNVSAISTEATNGKMLEQTIFTEENWTYNEETKEINIIVKNEAEEGNVWAGKGEDQYLITYVYENKEDNENIAEEQTLTLTNNITAQIKEYNKEEIITATSNEEKEITKTNELITTEIITDVQEMSKGKLYANHISNTDRYEITYETKVMVNIPYVGIIDENINLAMPQDTYLDKEGNALEKQQISYYKTTKIAKENFDEILGEEGYIRIVSGQTEIARIDSSTIEDEEGNYTITYTENFANLTIETSVPVKEGNLNLIHEKKINNSVSFTNEELVSIGAIETKANEQAARIVLTETNSGISVEIDREDLSSVAVNKDVTIKIILNNKDENTNLYQDPVFDVVLPENIADVVIKQTDILYTEGLSIAQVQKGMVGDKLAIRITLAGTQEEFSSGVLSNGTNIILKADITLKELCPNTEEVIEVTYQNNNPITAILGSNLGNATTNVNLTAPEEVLSIQTIKTDDNGEEITSVEDGKVAGKLEIFAEAKTKQMELKVLNNYKQAVSNLVILGRIPFAGNKSPEGIDLGSNFSTTLKTAITSSAEEATIYYSENETATNVLSADWKLEADIDLSKAKSYLIVFPEDYTLPAAGSLSFTYDFEVPANLEHSSDTYGAFTTYYNKTVGETPVAETAVAEFVGLSTGEGPRLKLELSANIEDGSVVIEGQRVIYTAKVTNTGNNVAENVVVTLPVPENMDYVEYDGQNYTIDGTVSEKQFTVESLNPSESQTFTMYAQVRSLPSIEEYYQAKKDENGYYVEKVTNVPLIEITQEEWDDPDNEVIQVCKMQMDGRYFYSDYQVNGEYYIHEALKNNMILIDGENYYMIVSQKEYVEEYIPISATARVNATKLDKEITSNEMILHGIKSDIRMSTSIEVNYDTNTNLIRELETIKYHISITNQKEENLEDLLFEMNFSKALEFERVDIAYVTIEQILEGIEFDESTKLENVFDGNKISYTIPELEAGKIAQIVITAQVKSLENEYEKEIIVTPKVTVGETTYAANPLESKIARASLEANLESSVENTYIKEGDTYTYTMTLTNNGIIATRNLHISNTLPAELTVKELYYEITDQKVDMAKHNNYELNTKIKPGETLKIVATVQVDKLPDGIEEREITNSFTITEENRNVLINDLRHIIEINPDYVPEEPTNPEDPNNPDNPNTPTDKTYKISGTVWLDENKNGQMEEAEERFSGIEVYLINEAGETIKTTTTNRTGDYVFEGLEEGKYIVAFKYDSQTYNLTDYQKAGVAGNVNSDVVGREGTAATDNIEITNTSIGNINMGLVEKETFDLRLDKYISRIVVQTANSTKEYKQQPEETLAKVEIKAKELKGSKVMMEYSIVITNEGKTAGYAKEIVDYMPRDTEFSSELNSGWYLGSDNQLHTTQLKDVLIQPGESKTITLVLTRNMTEENTNTVNNRAEILKSHNQDMLEDEDSIAGNQATGEDDIGSADIIIGIATGSEIVYITLAMICLIMLGTGAYLINQKVLRKEGNE